MERGNAYTETIDAEAVKRRKRIVTVDNGICAIEPIRIADRLGWLSSGGVRAPLSHPLTRGNRLSVRIELYDLPHWANDHRLSILIRSNQYARRRICKAVLYAVHRYQTIEAQALTIAQ
jgi:hypothetical protein